MVEVYIDGASAGNPGPSGAGVFINYKNGNVEHHSSYLGNISNHEAEFAALLLALKLCRERQIRMASFRTDSKLIEDAIEKKYINNKTYQHDLKEALSIIESDFDLFFIKWIPSKQNQQADQLARQAIQKKRK
ncbi:reverse transcriptase-like protein [Bacillus sp. JCM 19034]|uniref:reverse transcriptase-like protein n=1 Tax=Bacillus sp. JCM 19034 TaxID=1481928 RepID=UPI0007854CFA|nr:reverse transcriptase-like protein [Bacillus sp. JCM 19034]